MSMQRDWRKNYRLLTAPLRLLPNFIIPGESKCGTTTFYRCLTRHPDVAAADVKEPNNFIRYGASPNFCRMHYPLSVLWLGHRLATGRRLLTGEASPNYLATPSVPAVVAAMLPRVRIIVLMREPAARAFSDYQMMRAGGYETCEFESGILQHLEWLRNDALAPLVRQAATTGEGFLRYILKGVYVNSLRPWLQCFSREQFLFVNSEEFFAEPHKTLTQAFEFLGLRPHDVPDVPVLKKGRYDGACQDRAAFRALREFYRPYNEELYALLGRNLGWEAECAKMLG